MLQNLLLSQIDLLDRILPSCLIQKLRESFQRSKNFGFVLTVQLKTKWICLSARSAKVKDQFNQFKKNKSHMLPWTLDFKANKAIKKETALCLSSTFSLLRVAATRSLKTLQLYLPCNKSSIFLKSSSTLLKIFPNSRPGQVRQLYNWGHQRRNPRSHWNGSAISVERRMKVH